MMYMYLSLLIFFFSIIMFMMSLYYLYFNMLMMLNWIIINLFNIKINMLILMDWMNFMFMFLIFIISSMIIMYSYMYMMNDKNNMFIYLLMLFILSMIFMVISPNLISILLGWDGLGLTSYCLIIYYQSKYSYSSGNLTIFLNRIGDITLIMSISLMIIMSSWNFINLNMKFNNLLMTMMMMLIIITAFTKSAQMPFSSWLPVAMAAPTPVSSLVHSSTLVTAGIFLLIRFNNLIYNYNFFLMLVLIMSCFTMLMASMCAIFEYDMKKIIAYSTLSQLGLMMMIYSLKFNNLSFFHLIIHAMFKSMMFMCSGIFIHSLLNYQDIRFFGNMIKFMPLTMFMFFISNMSLCGMPYFSGFFSKDLILEMFMMMKINIIIYMILMFSTMLTMIYSMRLIIYMFNKNFNFLKYNNIKDNKLMNFSMMILMIFSIIVGMMMNWMIFFSIELIYLNMFNKILILLILLIGLIMTLLMFFNKFIKKYYINNMNLFNSMMFMYKLINLFLMILFIGKNKYKFLEKSWNEYYMSKSLINIIKMNNLINLYKINYLILILMFNLIMFYMLLM